MNLPQKAKISQTGFYREECEKYFASAGFHGIMNADDCTGVAARSRSLNHAWPILFSAVSAWYNERRDYNGTSHKVAFTGGDSMPLFILGLVFAVGLFIFYMVSTGGSGQDDGSDSDTSAKKSSASDLKKEDNVIFLPTDIEKAKRAHRKKS